MQKRMRNMLLITAILFGSIFGYKFLSGLVMQIAMSRQEHLVTVATMKVDYLDWPQELKAVGSVRAIKGVNVTTELAGLITHIYFQPGASVKKGDILVQLDADTEIGQLHALEASAKLAKITRDRDLAQYKVHAVSKQIVDNDEANLRNLKAQAASQAATVVKKTIRAPFDGQLGVNQVNPGQYLNVGDPIVTLQSLDPIWVDFYLPQQEIGKLALGQKVIFTTDARPGQTFEGKITTINPIIDNVTRNIEIEATIPNPQHLLLPGLFGQTQIIIGKPKAFLTVPHTALTFNPYGDLVYKVISAKDKKGKETLTVSQIFVQVGDTRGEQIQILGGLKKGETIVSAGQVKLKNGMAIRVNNSIQPPDLANPKLSNNH